MKSVPEGLVLLDKDSALEKQAIKDVSVTLKYFFNAEPPGIYVTEADYNKYM